MSEARGNGSAGLHASQGKASALHDDATRVAGQRKGEAGSQVALPAKSGGGARLDSGLQAGDIEAIVASCSAGLKPSSRQAQVGGKQTSRRGRERGTVSRSRLMQPEIRASIVAAAAGDSVRRDGKPGITELARTRRGEVACEAP